MRASGQSRSPARFLGYVQVQVASRVYVVPVESSPLELQDGATLQPGFFADPHGQLGIRVDAHAPEAVVREQIAAASAEAARHLSRKLLN